MSKQKKSKEFSRKRPREDANKRELSALDERHKPRGTKRDLECRAMKAFYDEEDE